jgi:TonB family protein
MNNRYVSLLSSYGIRIAGSVVVSFLLFSMISMLHGMFDITEKERKPAARQEVLFEMVKPPPKQDVQIKQHIRQVQQTQTAAQSGSTGNTMSMHFTPDLSVDAGGNGTVVELGQKELSAEVFEEGQTDELPKVVFMQPPVYDDRMREREISGTVTVKFTVTYEGKAVDIEILSSPHTLLSASVKKAISGAKFKPGSNKGIPVNVRVKQTFQFDLE